MAYMVRARNNKSSQNLRDRMKTPPYSPHNSSSISTRSSLTTNNAGERVAPTTDADADEGRNI
jgi:hypothetical protein